MLLLNTKHITHSRLKCTTDDFTCLLLIILLVGSLEPKFVRENTNMAMGGTPPKALKEKRTYPKSPATCTPTRLPKKMAKGSGIEAEDAQGISLRDLLVSINYLKVARQSKNYRGQNELT